MTPVELAATLRRLNDEAEREKSSNSRVAHLDRIVLLGDLAPALPDLIEKHEALVSAVKVIIANLAHAPGCDGAGPRCNCKLGALRQAYYQSYNALSAMCTKAGAQ